MMILPTYTSRANFEEKPIKSAKVDTGREFEV